MRLKRQDGSPDAGTVERARGGRQSTHGSGEERVPHGGYAKAQREGSADQGSSSHAKVQRRHRAKRVCVPSTASMQSKCPLNTGSQAWLVCVCLHVSTHTST